VTKRQEVQKFASLNGMTAKATKGGCAHGVVTLYRERVKGQWQTAWVDNFDNWADAHAFLLNAVKTQQQPWA
jgi:hypothetical protein